MVRKAQNECIIKISPKNNPQCNEGKQMIKQTILSQNITIVYDTLDLSVLDTTVLRNLFGKEVRPTIMDTPEMIVGVYAPKPLFVQIGERRIRITNKQKTEKLGEIPLWEIAAKSQAMLPEDKFTTIAFGYNYDIDVSFEDVEVYKMLKEKFIANITQLQEDLDGEVVSFTPRMRFTRGDKRYDFALEPFEPLEEQCLKAHLNAHFQLDGFPLPAEEEMKKSFEEEYQYYSEMLTSILER